MSMRGYGNFDGIPQVWQLIPIKGDARVWVGVCCKTLTWLEKARTTKNTCILVNGNDQPARSPVVDRAPRRANSKAGN